MDKEKMKELIEEITDSSTLTSEPFEVSEKDFIKFEQEVRDYFQSFLGNYQIIKQSWQIPEEYKGFLFSGISLFQGFYEDDIENETHFEMTEEVYDLKEVMRSNINPWYVLQLSEFRKRIHTDRLHEYDSIWLNIGWWSDKNEFFLCCDKSNKHFGKVIDCYNCTPWNYFEGDVELHNSFANFLLSIS